MAITDQVSKIQSVIHTMNLNDTLVDAVQMVLGASCGLLVDTGGGVLTANGASLSNVEYFRIGEVLGIVG